VAAVTDSIEAAPNPGLEFLARGFRASAQDRQSLLAAVEAGYAFSAVTVFGFLARKPEATDSVEP
jgi:hypothetical protein